MVDAENEDIDNDEQQCFMHLTHHIGFNCCRFEADNPRDMFLGNVTNSMVFDSIEEFVAWDRSAARSHPSPATPPSVDVAELCGGAADVADMLLRRGFLHGLNFDIIVGFNLRSPGHNKHMWQHLDARQPTIMIISTPCTGMKGSKAFNRAMDPHAYYASRNLSVPIGRIGGVVAYRQCLHKRHLISEHPRDSDLYKEKEWLRLAEDVGIAWCYVDQCMARSDRNAGSFGHDVRVKKPSEFWASDGRLIAHIQLLVCDGRHAHADIGCRGSSRHHAKAKGHARWRVDICRRIARGCEAVLVAPDNLQNMTKAYHSVPVMYFVVRADSSGALHVPIVASKACPYQPVAGAERTLSPLGSDNSYNATYFKTSVRPPGFTCTWAPNELAAQLEAKDAVKVYVDDWKGRTKARWNSGRMWQGQVQFEIHDGQWAIAQLRTWQGSTHTPISLGLDADVSWTGKRRTVMTRRQSSDCIRRIHE